MDKEQQKKVIKEIIDYELRTMLKLIDDGKIPEEWQGVELRHYIATQIDSYNHLIKGARKRKYNQARKDKENEKDGWLEERYENQSFAGDDL